jgi:hypothetical protein
MNIEGLFHSPGRGISDFARAQVLLFRQDPSLQDYFMQLELDDRDGPLASRQNLRSRSQLSSWIIGGLDNASRVGQSRRIKADVLFCPMPYFGRESENRLLVRTLLGLVQTDARVVCLLMGNAPCRAEIDEQLKAAGRSSQVEFVDPTSCSSLFEARVRARVVRMRAEKAFNDSVSILEPEGLSASQKLKPGFNEVARFVEAWQRLADNIEFDAVIARCHWHTLCSPVCRTALQRDKPVITFQQGVIGHSLDMPVTASKYVAFGHSSASFLERANRLFFDAVDAPVPPVEYVPGGSLIDDLRVLPDQFALQTLLIVDVPSAQSNFYGVESQCQALLELADKLLSGCSSVRRIVIRPHPFWGNLNFEECHRLVRKYPGRCEISHPSWSLDDDLRRSSAVIGIFSGVLTVASTCGLPTIFLQTEGGFTTGDLACFSPQQTLMPEEAYLEIERIFSDRHAYEQARAAALQNGREYYQDGRNADLSGSFFDRLLSERTLSEVPVESK